MCEYLERMRVSGTATEDIRSWSGYAHRVVELTGPSPTTDDVSVYLWLHKDSASLLLDMCDEIDSRFDALQAENEKLREQIAQLKLDWEGERDYADQMEAKEIRAVAENDKLRKKINALKAHGIEIADAVAGGYEIYDTSQREVDRLEVENGKLREALCSAWKCAHAGISCSDCRLIAGGCTLQTAMQELGIEVGK